MKNLSLIFLFLSIQIMAFSGPEEESVQSFEIKNVKILSGPFYQAQQADIRYLLALDPDRLLAPYLKSAGITSPAENYPNWENTGLDGHIGGHYLSALAYMYASTGKQELLDRLNYMTDWLLKCQEASDDGYVGGIPGGEEMWKEIAKGDIQAGSFSLNDKWVPLYNIHKLFAGLIDAYKITGNEHAKEVLLKLSKWFYETTRNLSDEQMQEMLRSEHGGMNEVFVDVAEISGDKKYLDLALRCSHRYLLEPLLDKKNTLTGMHANTQIPKVIGYEKYAQATHNQAWSEAADFFWETIVQQWTISIGGNSVKEHFHPADDFSSMVESNQGPETCNTYNMLKLTKLLYLSHPQAKYLDYYERALFNHILSSEHPSKGGFVYFTPMRPRHYRVYSQPQEGFWCCVGSGIENPGRYGEMIYAHTDKEVFVNLFINSELRWEEQQLTLTQDTRFPYSETTEITLQPEHEKTFTLSIRKPEWAVDERIVLEVNGKKIPIPEDSTPYISLERMWKPGDVVKLTLPMETSVEYLPDHSNWISFVHGPIVLAAVTDTTYLDGLWADDSRMGHVASGPFYPVDEAPMLVTASQDVTAFIQELSKDSLRFTISDLIYQSNFKNLILKPFFEVHEARYMIYWPLFTPESLKEKFESIKDSENDFILLEKQSIDQVATGEQQPETDHNFKGENTRSGYNITYWRDTESWFSYDLNDPEKEGATLRITYFGLDGNRDFDILINDMLLTRVHLEGDKGPKLYDVDYSIPDILLLQNKEGKMNLKFVAAENSRAGGIYYIRLLR
ncbi:MAG: glycoside hydrolase family 127 protein [Bacteroidales bacterium]|nr:glycoside hydrolase family 127 protein [Bacteroidales bacterium]